MAAVNEKCYTARVINSMLSDKKNEIYFIFLKPLLFEINRLNLSLQSDSCGVGSAYCDMSLVIQSLSRRIIKPLFLNSESSKDPLKNILQCVTNCLAFLSADVADLGCDFHKELVHISKEDAAEIQRRCLIFLIKLLTELVQRLPPNMQIFEKINLFSAANLKNNTPFQDMPFKNFINLTDDSLVIESSWRKICQVDFSNYFDEGVLSNVLKFWPAVYEFKDASGQQVFKELAEIVLRYLSIPISNATVERVFSIMNAVKTKRQNRMKLKTLDSLMRIRLYSSVRNKCCLNLTPTSYMLELFNSNVVYANVDDTSEDLNEVLDTVDLILT